MGAQRTAKGTATARMSGNVKAANINPPNDINIGQITSRLCGRWGRGLPTLRREQEGQWSEAISPKNARAKKNGLEAKSL